MSGANASPTARSHQQMRALSIRMRLTLWYFAVLLVTFTAFCGGIFLALQMSVHATIDEDLHSRLAGVQRIMERHDPSIRNYDIGLPPGDVEQPLFQTIQVKDTPLRVLSGEVSVAGNNYIIQLAAPMAEAYDIPNDFKWLLLASLPIALIVASSGGYWMSRRALAPVDGITSTARSISEHNLSKRLAIAPTGMSCNGFRRPSIK